MTNIRYVYRKRQPSQQKMGLQNSPKTMKMELFVLDRQVLSQIYEVVKLQREIVAKLVVVRTIAVRRAVLSPIMINIRSELLSAMCAISQCHQVVNTLQLFQLFQGIQYKISIDTSKRTSSIVTLPKSQINFSVLFLEQQLKNTLFKLSSNSNIKNMLRIVATGAYYAQNNEIRV